MSQVNTVPGPIDSCEMGFTLSHEHISSGAAAADPGFQDRQAIADAATAALAEAYDGGSAVGGTTPRRGGINPDGRFFIPRNVVPRLIESGALDSDVKP